MADINVDVILPAPINVDVTSPTQSVNTNVYVPGPQGPAGPIGPSGLAGIQGPSGEKGNPTEINGLSGSSIILTGVDGNIIYTNNLDRIFISGNSGHFQSAVNTLSTNLGSTGLNLENKINSLSGTLTGNYVTKSNGQFINRPTVNGTGVLLSGEVAALPDTIVYTTGDQIISGNKTFVDNLEIQGTGIFNNIDLAMSDYIFDGVNIEITNSTVNVSGDIFISGNKVLTGVDLSSYATTANLAQTGSTLDTKINTLSGSAVLLYGNQTVNGTKTFNNGIIANNISGTATFNSLNLTAANALYGGVVNINGGSGVLAGGAVNISSGPRAGSETNHGQVAINGSTVFVNGNTNSYARTFRVYKTGVGGPLTNLDVSQNSVNVNNTFTISGVPINPYSYAISGDAVLVYGDQNISGNKSFVDSIGVSGTGTFNALDLNNVSSLLLSGTNINITGNSIVNIYNPVRISGNEVLTGVDLSSYATVANLASTGSTLDSKIDTLSGYVNTQDNAISSNLISTGQTLTNNLISTGNSLNLKIDNLSGYSNNTFATITNLASTGSTLDGKINTLSGYADNTFATITNLASTGSTLSANLISTGDTLDTKINSLSGSAVLLYGDQTIDGTKTFRDRVYIHDLYVTGEEFIANVTNNFIESPYIILNLTGGAFDGGIFFVTGSGLTGINDLGPIIGFDHTDKFKFGISTRGSDLSTLNDIAAFQDITAYSGFVDGKYATIINLASTGSTLDTKINTLSGYSDNTFATITNLTSTGSTLASNLVSTGSTLQTNINTVSSNLISTGNNLEGKINSLSGTLTSTYATISNLASTGATLDSKIDSLSGYSNSTFATIINLASTGSTLTSNLASTGSTLNTKIDNLSGYVNSTGSNIVFTTGNQNITGIKIFTSPLIISGADLSGINTNGTQGFRLTSRALGLLGDSLQTVLVNEGYGGITQLGTDGNTTLRIQRGDNSSAVLPNNTSLGWYKPSPSNVGEVPDVRLWRDGSGILSLRSDNISRGSTYYITPSGMQFRVFNITGTNTGEFGLFGWQNNELVVGAQTTNSGILRSLVITGDSISYTGKRLTIAHTNAGLFFDALGPTIRGNHWGAGDAGFITYRNGLDMGRGGAKFLRVDAANPTVIVGRGSSSYEVGVGFDGTNSNLSSPDVFILRDQANILAQRNGINAQQFRVYNITGTNTGEFGLVGWINSGLVIGPQQTNSGILRDLTLTGRNININASGVFNIFDNTNISGNVNITGNTAFTARPTVNGTGVLLSGEVTPLPVTIVYTTGDQTIGGNKTFTGVTTFSGQEVNLVDTALNLSGVGDMTFSGTNINFINSPVFISGTNLRVSGDVFANNLVYNTGDQIISGTKEFQSIKLNKNRFLSYDYETGNFNIIDYITIVNCTLTGSGDFATGVLPTGNISGFNYIIKNINACPVLITGSGNYLIDRTPNLYIYSGESVELLGVTATNLTGWYTLNTNLGVV